MINDVSCTFRGHGINSTDSPVYRAIYFEFLMGKWLALCSKELPYHVHTCVSDHAGNWLIINLVQILDLTLTLSLTNFRDAWAFNHTWHSKSRSQASICLLRMMTGLRCHNWLCNACVTMAGSTAHRFESHMMIIGVSAPSCASGFHQGGISRQPASLQISLTRHLI